MARKKRSQTTCTCTAYPFPHRDCGGGCAKDDTPEILLRHERGRGFVGERGIRPECLKPHKAKGRHTGAARAQAAARRRARSMVR